MIGIVSDASVDSNCNMFLCKILNLCNIEFKLTKKIPLPILRVIKPVSAPRH